ncbi:TPA: transcriptional regulator [Escherichia coli]|nr:transcriptional regulator [Escherichia coli]EID6494398.1 winged helix-turn-helix domain-containing protein [Escherichia coli]QXB75333.1 winged helix-turn-helix domain-containing protein [Escherichia coli]QXC28351.1 winged helix-turn-helix domain-containing protein [Escherichia coli]HAJ7213905.1 transcriptional regulator [Escherichia coli]
METVNSHNKIFIDTLKNTIIINGESSLLSKNECLLLKYFYERQGIIIPRDELIQQCWPGRVVSPTSLPVAIKHIRDILKKTGHKEVIVTHKGEGYSLLPNTLDINFTEATAENKPRDLKETSNNKHYLLQPRQVLSAITIGLSIFLSAFLGLTLCSNNIKHFRIRNGALIISNSEMVSQVTDAPYQEGSFFMDKMGAVLICNKFKCNFTQ